MDYIAKQPPNVRYRLVLDLASLRTALRYVQTMTSYNLYYVKYRYFVAFQATIAVQAK